MILTSCHENWDSDKYKTVAISGNRGRDANYKGECYPKLAPKLGFWKIWHENIVVLPEEENNHYYIEEYYKQVLSKLNPQEVYEELDGSVLLCYEQPDKFCHRHIVAAWFELLLNTYVPEVKTESDRIIQVERLTYIKEYLQEVMAKEDYEVLKLKRVGESYGRK